jgi:hypothetical protein
MEDALTRRGFVEQAESAVASVIDAQAHFTDISTTLGLSKALKSSVKRPKGYCGTSPFPFCNTYLMLHAKRWLVSAYSRHCRGNRPP